MKSARWRFVAPDGREFLPYGTKLKAAEYLAWLLDLEVADVYVALVRVDLIGPGLASAKPDLNARAEQSRVIRKRGAS